MVGIVDVLADGVVVGPLVAFPLPGVAALWRRVGGWPRGQAELLGSRAIRAGARTVLAVLALDRHLPHCGPGSGSRAGRLSQALTLPLPASRCSWWDPLCLFQGQPKLIGMYKVYSPSHDED